MEEVSGSDETGIVDILDILYIKLSYGYFIDIDSVNLRWIS